MREGAKKLLDVGVECKAHNLKCDSHHTVLVYTPKLRNVPLLVNYDIQAAKE